MGPGTQAHSISGFVTGLMFMSQRGHKNSVCLHRDSWALSALILESCHSSGIKYADQAFHGVAGSAEQGVVLFIMD